MEITLNFMSGAMFKAILSSYTNSKQLRKYKDDKDLKKDAIDTLDNALIMLEQSQPKEIHTYRVGSFITYREKLTSNNEALLIKLLEAKCYKSLSAYYAVMYKLGSYKDRSYPYYSYRYDRSKADLPPLDIDALRVRYTNIMVARNEQGITDKIINTLISDGELPESCRDLSYHHKVEAIGCLFNVRNYSYTTNGSYNLAALFNSHNVNKQVSEIAMPHYNKEKCKSSKMRTYYSNYYWGHECSAFGRHANVLTMDNRAEIIANHISNLSKHENLNSSKILTLVLTFIQLEEATHYTPNGFIATVSNEDLQLVWNSILDLCKANKKILGSKASYNMILDVINIFGKGNKYVNELIKEIYKDEKIKKLTFERKIS